MGRLGCGDRRSDWRSGGPADELTVPAGAAAGAEVGLWVANSLGLASLLIGIAKNLGAFIEYAKDASEIAWYAGENPHIPEHSDRVQASTLYAYAIAELWMALLTALVAEVMKRAGEYTAKRIASNEALRLGVNDVAKRISESKLGRQTGEWFRSNFEQIQRAVEKRKAELKRAKEKQDSASSEEAQSSGSKGNQPSPYVVPDKLTTSSGIPIKPTPGKTTTVLGTFGKGTPGNMDDIINNQLHYPKTTDFDAKPGGFNVLNVPDDYYKNPDQFWNEYNKPILDDAINRGDNISLATKPERDLLVKPNGDPTGFGRELEYLNQNGYSYDSSTNSMVRNMEPSR